MKFIDGVRPESLFKGKGPYYSNGTGTSGRPREIEIKFFRVDVDAAGQRRVTSETAVMTGQFRSTQFEKNYRHLTAQRVALDAGLIEQLKEAPGLKDFLTFHDLTGIDFADYKGAEERLNMLIARNARMTLTEIKLADLKLPEIVNGGTPVPPKPVAPKHKADFHVFLLPEEARPDFSGAEYLLKFY
ncbi:MAG: hypothetical protein PHG97_06650 [Candidatus Margulisbacteria bacterium]|nr:hypothetical protein [Candidatus Margulisiibacteriota bacterium]